MMNGNPYESPESAAGKVPVDGPEYETKPDVLQASPFPYYLSVVQFSLRLLGVYFLVVGGSGLAEEVYRVFYQIQFLKHEAGFDTVYASNLVSCSAYVVCGLYLVFDCTWLIRRIFLPAGTAR